MTHFSVSCTRCGTPVLPDMSSFLCPRCDSTLEVVYTDAGQVGPQPAGWTGPSIPLPVHDADSFVSLGEGDTPCVALPALGSSLGLDRLTAKLEFLNPTGSYKDRGTVVMMSVARELGVTEVVEDSSGNAGASVAAYAARAGIKAHVFAPASAPAAKISQIRVYGATPHLIEGPREAATEAALAYVRERGVVYASHNLSPYFLEGTKSFAYEVLRQLGPALPEHIVVPVGNGSLYLGAWKGFSELKEGGHIDVIPRLHCVQAKAVMPIVAAFSGEEWASDGSGTVAGGIASANPPHAEEILRMLGASGGSAVPVEEAAILGSQRRLAELEGIYAEPTSAAAFAGLMELVDSGIIQKTDRVLVPVTGFGLKDAPPA